MQNQKWVNQRIHPVKRPIAFMAAAGMKCAVCEGDHSFGFAICSPAKADVQLLKNQSII